MKKLGVRLVRTTLLLLLSFPGGVLGENAGFNPAVLGFQLGHSGWGAVRASPPFPALAKPRWSSALGKKLCHSLGIVSLC